MVVTQGGVYRKGTHNNERDDKRIYPTAVSGDVGDSLENTKKFIGGQVGDEDSATNMGNSVNASLLSLPRDRQGISPHCYTAAEEDEV